MIRIFFIGIFLSVMNLVNAQGLNVDSLYSSYKDRLEIYSDFNPEISGYEKKKNSLNETIGLIILANTKEEKLKIINEKFSKEKREELKSKTDQELEKYRYNYDRAFKAKILQLCLDIELKIKESSLEDMKKSRVNYLLSNGINLIEFKNLSEEKQAEILKGWKY